MPSGKRLVSALGMPLPSVPLDQNESMSTYW